jgi:hypothetical protein
MRYACWVTSAKSFEINPEASPFFFLTRYPTQSNWGLALHSARIPSKDTPGHKSGAPSGSWAFGRRARVCFFLDLPFFGILRCLFEFFL